MLCILTINYSNYTSIKLPEVFKITYVRKDEFVLVSINSKMFNTY